MEFLANLLLFFVPFERIPSAELFGLTVRPSTVVILLFILAVLPVWIIRKRILPLSSIDKSIIAYYLVVLASIGVASGKKRAVIVAALLGFVICGYLLISRTYRKTFNYEKISQVLIWAGLATAIFGLYQFFGDGLFGLSSSATGLLPRYTKAVLGWARVQSVGVEPLYYANFLMLPIFILGSRILTTKKSQYFDMVILTILVTTFILTLSRGAFIAFVCGIAVMVTLVILYKSLRPNFYKLVLIGIVSAILSQLAVVSISGVKAVSGFSEQAANPAVTAEASNNPRMVSYLEALRLFKTKPILGVGIGNFGVVGKLPKDIIPEGYAVVNNQYLETLAETGLVGFLALFALGVIVIWRLVDTIIRSKGKSAPVIALAATFAGFIIQYNFFSTIYILYLWVLIGLIDALPQKAE